MKRKTYTLAVSFTFALAIVATLSSCKKKEQAADIYIAPTEEQNADNKPKMTGDETVNADIEWIGYDCKITRTHQEGSSIADDNGNKYYDNNVSINITHAGANVFSRTFRQTDFSAYINGEYMNPSERILEGITYNKIVDGNATFIAKIVNANGDKSTSVQITVDKNGGMTMQSMAPDNNGNEGNQTNDENAKDVSELSGDFVGD